MPLLPQGLVLLYEKQPELQHSTTFNRRRPETASGFYQSEQTVYRDGVGAAQHIRAGLFKDEQQNQQKGKVLSSLMK